MEAWVIWLAAAGVLLIAEILTQTLWCLSLAIVCAIVCVAALLGASFNVQLIILALSAIASYFILMPIFRHQRHLRGQPDTRNARTGMDALLGRKATVTHEVKPGMLGRARIDGDNWQIKAPGTSHAIPEGEEVVVTGFDSIILEVSPVKKSDF